MFIKKTETKTVINNDYNTIQNCDRYRQLVEIITKQTKTQNNL